MNKIGWALIVGILGAFMVSLAAGIAVEDDYVNIPHRPGVTYPVQEVWGLDDGSTIIFHQFNKTSGSASFQIWNLEIRETVGHSWVEIGEKDPTILTVNPEDLKKKSVKDFEKFLSAKRGGWYLVGYGVLFLVLLVIGLWPVKKES